MPLSSTLMLASRVAVGSLPPAQAIARQMRSTVGLIVVRDRGHRGARASDELVDDVGFFRGDGSWPWCLLRSAEAAVVLDLELDAHRLLPIIYRSVLHRNGVTVTAP